MGAFLRRSPVPILALTTLLVASIAEAGESVTMGGTGIVIVPPDGFHTDRVVYRLRNDAADASILAVGFPFSLQGLRGRVSDQGIETDFEMIKMRIERDRSVMFGEHEGQLITGTDESDGVTYELWVALIGDMRDSSLLVARCPVRFAHTLCDGLESAVRDATWEPKLPPGMRIREPSLLRIERTPDDFVVLTNPMQSSGGPRLTIQSRPNDGSIRDIEDFALDCASRVSDVTGLDDLEGNVTQIGGRPAYEMTAFGVYGDDAAPVVFYQTAVDAGEKYYLVQGVVAVTQGETYLPQFREVARSLDVD